MESYGFDWESLYVGARAGGFFADDIDAAGVIGAAVGVNFIPADPFLVGVEVTGDYVWGDDIVDQGQFFANLRAGAVVTDPSSFTPSVALALPPMATTALASTSSVAALSSL
ncbi:hypothetical protein [Devosia aurantiaca]|uniref:Uncharacterized protein n=1 Tax=Devosia aurantiaca TaxID=2714858 RepID=A0A6M1SRB4_9HYPH|nr:hypothetical protein [Devosia aurantiaca]NGP19174.1 hypothetical protein [Devosia aurantiaca]